MIATAAAAQPLKGEQQIANELVDQSAMVAIGLHDLPPRSWGRNFKLLAVAWQSRIHSMWSGASAAVLERAHKGLVMHISASHSVTELV